MLLNSDVGRVLEYTGQPRKQMNGSLNKIIPEFSLKPLMIRLKLFYFRQRPSSREGCNAGKDRRKGRKEKHDQQ